MGVGMITAAMITVGAAIATHLVLRRRNRARRHGSVTLATSVKSPFLPTAVFIHGMDSSRITWSRVIGDLTGLGYPTLGIDLRGHGESDCGDVNEFSAHSIAADVLQAIRDTGIERAVLIGHSLGGQVVMRAAAIDASSMRPLLVSVVIEDIDVRERPASDYHADVATLTDSERTALASFERLDGRRFATEEDARAALGPWYANPWAGPADIYFGNKEGLHFVRKTRGAWWSDVNPRAQRLSIECVLGGDGSRAWDELGAYESLPFPLHLWCADENTGSVIRRQGPGGLEDMRRRLPATIVRIFRGARHSIHHTARAEYVEAVCEVIEAAALQQ